LIYRSNRGWKGGAPWLFPAVGRNIIGGRPAWKHGENRFPMPIHGFAKDAVWRLARKHRAIQCDWSSDRRSRSYFPFDFTLRIRYSLAARSLRATVRVRASARNREAMPFSLGNHISLRAPFIGGNAAACWIRSPARFERLLTSRGLLSGERRAAGLRRARRVGDLGLSLDRVYGGYPAGGRWFELSDPESFGIRVRQRELAAGRTARASKTDYHFVVYADLGAGFFCPEPWLGMPNSLNRRRGIVSLEPGRTFGWEMRLQFL